MTLHFHLNQNLIRLVIIEIVLFSLLALAEQTEQHGAQSNGTDKARIAAENAGMVRREAARSKGSLRKSKSDRFQGDDFRNGGKSRYSGKMFFAVAATNTGQVYSRAFNKTLANITQSYITGKSNVVTYNISLETLTIELPESGSFSSHFLQSVCSRFEGKHIVAVLIVGNSNAAFTVALAAGHAGVPVLWARGTHSFLPGFNNLELSPFEVYLEPSSRELIEALRALFLQTHWHSFTILADDTVMSMMLQRKELVNILEEPPLHPTIMQLPSIKQPHALFRRLADISRSTRGVVILMCDRPSAGRVLDEAKRLNMMDGHFVWLWIDTVPNNTINGGVTSSFPPTDRPSFDYRRDKRNASDDGAEEDEERKLTNERNKRDVAFKNKEFLKSDISDMNVNYLVKNDQFLLFNRQQHNGGVESSKYYKQLRDSIISVKKEQPWRLHGYFARRNSSPELPAGLLSIRAVPTKVDRHLVRGAVRLLVGTLKAVLAKCPDWLAQSIALQDLTTSCWTPPSPGEFNFSTVFSKELQSQRTDALAGKKLPQENGPEKVDKSLVSNFEIANLVPETYQKDAEGEYIETTGQGKEKLKWRTVGHVTGRTVHLDTIVWPGGGIVVSGLSSQARSVFRVVTALAPPFVMESSLDEDGQCLRGLPCHRVLTSDKDNLTLVFNDMETQERMEEEDEDGHFKTEHGHQAHYDTEPEDKFSPFHKYKYRTNCCYGLAMDLLENIARELQFDFRLYIVADGLFGTRVSEPVRFKRDVGKAYLNYKFKQEGIFNSRQEKPEVYEDDTDEDVKWNGIVGDLVSGAAHMSFAALSVSSSRSDVIDFSTPFFFSGVSFLAAPQQKSEIPLMAFLLPFSPELWIAIFTSLNVTAIAVAIYEWLSPFGLNPWGRQRSKNFSMSSALWVMWGLLCGHLVAFKAPKSWPNKFLINVWGGFSVIFVASYTANIAALIAGLFFQNTVSNYNDRSLLSQKVGAPRASAAEYYVKRASKLLWEHMHRYSLENVEDGIQRLRNGSLDILIADTPILDYYRATDNGCTLQKIGDTITEDTYAVGMAKGFPLKDSVSAVIAKYASNGYMDILQEKWYGGLPCFKLVTEIAQPRPLGVTAVTGVFILLGVGMILGCLILLFEHLFYRYTLPILRHKPKGTIWKSRNIMFFSQKLYRFINCVELVSPHHAARELVHTLRQGQITSLFQKSVKRKEHEQRRRRKSKAQFFEMIQEIRRQQQEVRQQPPLASLTEVDSEYQLSPDEKKTKLSPNIIRRTFMRTSPKLEQQSTLPLTQKAKSPQPLFGKPLFSPRSKARAKSQTALNVRRFSTDSVFNSQTLTLNRSSAIGRRLSKDATFLSSSPPDINSRRSSYLDMINSSNKLSGKSPVLSIENVSTECDAANKKSGDVSRKYSDAESIGRKLATLPKYKDGANPNRLHPGDLGRLNMGKSEETLSKSTDYNNEIQGAKSCTNIENSGGNKKELEVDHNVPTTSSNVVGQKNNLSDDEIARRNKLTIEQLKTQLDIKIESIKPHIQRTQSNTATSTAPRIQVEDTSKPRTAERRVKHRHRSLGEAPKSPLPQEPAVPARRNKRVTEHSRSLDGPPLPPRDSSRNRGITPKLDRNLLRDPHDLPPAPPPPNISPRNSNGRSPLERLSKDELVNLWRSSESELRSHLLKAIRDKDADDPP